MIRTRAERAAQPSPPLVRAALALACGCALLGCQRGQATVRSTSPGAVVGIAPSEILGPYVPAGRQMSITLDQGLSAYGSVSGEPFTATARSELLDTDGRVLVPRGTRIRGHVVRVTLGATPQIVLAFDTVQTRLGHAPLIATVVYVEQGRTPMARVERNLLSSPATSLPPEGVPITSFHPPAQNVVLPAGTDLRIELTRPLFPPGTMVGR